MELNFMKTKKERLTLTLPDSKKLTLNPPKYKTLKKFSILDENATNEDIQNVVTEILNMNTEGREFTPEDVESLFDLADIYALMAGYTEYLSKLINQKN